MKKRMFRSLTVILAITLTAVSFSGCKKGSADGLSSAEVGTSSVSSVPEYVYDEEKKAVIDTRTGEVVSDAEYNEGTKEIVKNGKVIQKNTEKVSTSETEKIIEKKNEEIKKSSNDGKGNNASTGKNSTPSSGSSNSGNSTPTKNDEYQFSGQPSSSKKVVFNKEKLKTKMYSVYDSQKPQLTLRPKLGKEEYINYFNGTCPDDCKYIYDWYMDCFNNKKDGVLTISRNKNCDLVSFSETMFTKTYIGAFYSIDAPQGKDVINIKFNINDALQKIDQKYDNYAKPIDDFNAKKKAQYDKDVAQYEKDMMGYLPETIDMVANAVNSAGIKQGETEVSAVNKIVLYISDKCAYYKEAEDYHDGSGQWILNCLEDKRAVCDGYAKSFYAMCYYCGIDTDYYVGKTGEGKSHAWNSVTVNGKKYMFDVTWYDIQKTSSIQDGKYLWVAHGDKTFNSNHIGNVATPTYW